MLADSLSAELPGKCSSQIRKWHGAGKVVWEKSELHSGVGKPLQDFKIFPQNSGSLFDWFCLLEGTDAAAKPQGFSTKLLPSKTFGF